MIDFSTKEDIQCVLINAIFAIDTKHFQITTQLTAPGSCMEQGTTIKDEFHSFSFLLNTKSSSNFILIKFTIVFQIGAAYPCLLSLYTSC
mmetsp:Transcript_20486/g.42189  ORF Transcript_20486/g.42189 Transcript_20486/m.42189 type:complete len:90 (-) Transcript_20486:225-494(-)